jgi:amino acid adenylation domain-containing protein
MVPAVFAAVDDIPVTPAGKVDRGALPAPSAAGEARRHTAPGDEVEAKLAGIWAEILGMDRNTIGIEDDFFHLGGHSLRAMILLSRVKKVFNVEVPLQQIFDQPTLRAFAHVIKHGDKHLYEAITPVEKREYYPLSSAQKRLLILDQFDHISTSYNMSTAVKIKGTPDRARLEHAFQQMILRHESLRTAFPWVNDEPVQKIHDRPAFAIEYYPYRGDEEQKSIERMIEDFIRPFDLSRPPLLRVGLAPLTDNEYLLMFDMHHTIGDGTTDSILLQELTCFYHGETLPPLTIQYKDFSTWQNHLFAAGLIDKQEAYWLNCYRDIDTLERVNLPADHTRPAVMTFEGNHYSFTIDDIRPFKELTGANGATLFMGLLTVFNIWLYKLTGQGDAAVGTAVAGRPHADLQQIIGMFVNTLVIRNHPHESKSFVQLLAGVKENCLRAYENQDLQFEELVERLNPERDSSRNPLFDVSLVLQNYENHHVRVEDITFTPLEFENVTSKYDLTFFCIEMGTGLYFNVEYYSRIFERESIQRFVGQFRYILHQVENDPYRCAGDIRLLPEHEKERILREFNDTRTPYPFHLGIHELFAEQVTRGPGRIALVGADGGHLTYRALDENANQLANYLLHGHGLRPETPVGVLLDRGIDAAAALAGILKAGGGYVPLDPDWPEKRLKTVVHDARIPILISGKRYIRILNRLQWECPSLHTFLCLDTVDVYGEEETEKSSFMDKKLWDYVAGTAVDDITAGGWLSSYTGRPFSRQEMDEYGDNILAKLMPLLHPAVRVLEIGCASGISMYRIAPRVGYYLGTDLSAVTIEKNRERVRREGHSNIVLACLPAHEIDQIREQPFDLVIINSVIQAFHGHNYLRQVIAKTAALLKNRGYLFIGDVMDLDLKDVLVGELETFKQQHKDKSHKTKTDWSAELFIPRQFFADLVTEIPGFTGVEFSNKIYTVENELTRFRYDALFTRDKTGTAGGGRKNKYQEDLRALEPYEGTLPRVRVSPCQLAYVMYTSGSTGIPKGVMVEHRNVVRLVKNTNYVPFEPGDRILPTGALEFDASTFEVWGALTNGLQLYPVPKHVLLDPVNLKLHLLKYDIGTLWMTAPFFNRMVDADVEIFQGPRYLLVGGDVLSPAHINRVRKAYPQLTIINGYGPTENTTFSCTFRIDGEYTGNIPIGSPIANSTDYIMDKHNQPVPIGVEGELVVGGDGVSRGYLNDPELTGEKFIEYRSYRTYRTYISKKLYKTGDLARWLRDGNIEFLVRMDTQVKIRGYRIEPGEVRNRLLRRPDIKDAVVIVPGEEKDAGLRAYVVLTDGSKEVPADLTGYLCRDLPEYMIPSHFIPIEKIPLAPTGKVDRKALPRPRDEYRYGEGDEVYTAPADEVERRLADIWSGILGLAAGNISTTADFFRLGGHSLRAATLVSRIHKEFDVKVPLAEVFRQPYIRELAGFLRVTGKDRFRRIEPSPEMDYYPQSSAQKRLFLLDRFENAGTGYNMSTVLRINGSFDKNRLELALKKLIHRHETLRTRFGLMGNEPVQIVQPPENVAFQVETMEIDAAEDQAREQIKTTLAGWIRPFDLRRAPLLRVGLVKLRGDVHFLLLDMHHIISDGTSLGIFFNECLRLYLGEELPPMRIRYKDFSSWQARNSHMIRPQEEYWLNRFKGEIPVLELPTDYPRPALMTFAGASHDFLLGGEETAALNHLAAREGVTLFMLLTAIFNVLLYKYTGRTDIVVGSGVAGRNHADLQDIIGMFVNLLPMRSQPEPHRRFPAFLRQVKQISLEALENQDVQFENLVEKINPLRDTSRNPIFDVTFVNQNYEVPAQELAGVTFAPVDLENRTSRFDLTLFAYETGGNIYFQLEYYVRIFKAQTIRRLAGHLQNLIIAVTADPDREIAYLPIISTEEKHRLLYDFNDTTAAFPKNKTIHQLFAEQAERSPGGTALVGSWQLAVGKKETMHITYGVLNEKADRLAAFLHEKGVLADSIIGIMMEQSIGMIIGILGILKAGGAYLPIDPGYPQERIDYMLKDSGAKILLINLSEADLHHSSHQFITHNSGALAYVIYTSGSTGWPKGAAVSQRSLVNLCYWHNCRFAVTAADRASKFAGPGFDASVWEIFPYLIMGASLCLVPEEIKTGVENLNRYFETHDITISFLPTAVCEAFMELENRSLRVLLTGADKLKRFKKRAYRLVNNYGPTENTVVTTSFTVEREEADIPIGRPIFNQRVYILDTSRGLQPMGVPGELCIAGEGLAAGYLNNPELTAEKFVFLYRSYRSYGSYRTYISKKIYKTGDLGRWLGDGNIQFLGRIDQQVKIRGYRIEPGEIETRLLEHGAVKQAVVIARGEDANKYLCAYLVYEGGADNIQIPELRQYLLRTLPDHMVPVFFVPLGHIPLTPNGKVDQKALPLPGITANDFCLPGTAMEEKLAVLWSGVLEIEKEKIGIDADFFELGGHSLRAAVLVEGVQKTLNLTLPLVEVFKTPNIRGLARYLEAAAEPGTHMLQCLKKAPSPENLFFVHDGTGGVEMFIRLCGSPDMSYNCWGIRARWLRGYAPRELTVERIAAGYIEGIREIQPKGPYRVVGFSIGGVLAFEVARRLIDSGQAVEFLGIIDALSPRHWQREIEPFTVAGELEFIRHQVLLPGMEINKNMEQARSLEELWEQVYRRLETHGDAVPHILSLISRRGIPYPGEGQGMPVSPGGAICRLNILRTLTYALAFYKPTAITTNVYFFKAEESTPIDAGEWSANFDGSIEVRHIPGDHFTLLQPPYVEQLAGDLSACLLTAART